MHNDEAFGSYEVKAPPSSLNTNGRTWYNAEITHAAVARDAAGKPIIGKNDDTKTRVDVTFAVTEVVNEHTGNPEELRSRFTISYGQSNAGPWSRFAVFLAAVTKVPCGDPRQKQVGPKHLVGKKVSLCPVMSDTGYVNVKEVGPYDPTLAAPTQRQPVAVAAATRALSNAASTDAFDAFVEDEIPF